MARQTAIKGTGIELGARRVTNDELATLVDSSHDWIFRRTGIESRYFVEPGQSNASMALAASKKAMEEAQCQAKDLDAIIFATLTPDVAFPGTGVFLQDALGAGAIPALDVRNQCSGFLYGLSVADAWLRAGVYERILLVGSEIHSTGLNFSREGRDVAVLFGDGAGAVIVEAVEDSPQVPGRLVDLALGADGSGAHLLTCQRPGSKFHPSISADDIAKGLHFPTMEGRTVFRRAVEVLTREVEAAIERVGVDPGRVVLIPHQSNRRINEMVADRAGISPERVIHTIEEWGNTTAASIPMALHKALASNKIEEGDVVVMVAFGSGLTWGTAVLRY